MPADDKKKSNKNIMQSGVSTINLNNYCRRCYVNVHVYNADLSRVFKDIELFFINFYSIS